MDFDNLPIIVQSPQAKSPSMGFGQTFNIPKKSVYKQDNNTQLSSRSRNDGMSITGSKFGVEMSQISKTPRPNADISVRSARGQNTNPFSPRTNMTIKEYVSTT